MWLHSFSRQTTPVLEQHGAKMNQTKFMNLDLTYFHTCQDLKKVEGMCLIVAEARLVFLLFIELLTTVECTLLASEIRYFN